MTTLAVDTRTFRLQLELRVERRHECPDVGHRASSAARRADARASATRAQERLDHLRTSALAQRLPGF